MRVLPLVLLIQVAGCASQTELAPPEPARPSIVQGCEREMVAVALREDPVAWLREMLPLVGCPMTALDDPMWGFEGHDWVPLPGTDGRSVESQEGAGAMIEVVVLPEGDAVDILMRTVETSAAQDALASAAAVLSAAFGPPTERGDGWVAFDRIGGLSHELVVSSDGETLAMVVRPPPPDADVSEEDIIEELDDLSESPGPVPMGPPPPPDPLDAFPQCRSDRFGQAFGFQVQTWVPAVGPLLGCPEEALDEPEWMLTENRTQETIDGMTRIRVPDPNGSELEVAFDIRDGRIVRATRWMTPDAQRVVSFFRLEAALAPDRLGAEPVLDADDRQVYAPSDARPFWVDFFRTPDAIVLEITDVDDLAPRLDAPEPSAEADDLAAGGEPCDAPLRRDSEPFSLAYIDVVAQRLGCPFDEALDDFGLTDPIETLDAGGGGVVLSFTGITPIHPALVVSAQQKQGRLAAIAIQWPGETTAGVQFGIAKSKALLFAGEDPDLDEETRAMWFDDEDLRVGIVVQELADRATLQLIDARWF